MNILYQLQFACFIFMVINAMIVGVSSLHVKWRNRRYERSRWMIFFALLGLAGQYLAQMVLGIRASGAELGAIFNILVYTPCFTLIAMGIYNIEATHSRRRLLGIVCGGFYAAILAVFAFAVYLCDGLNLGGWLYALLALFLGNVVYYISMVSKEIHKRKNMLEAMTATDLLPYVRYAKASIICLFLATLVMVFAILSTPFLLVVGPLALLSLLFFNLSFIALGYSYVPTEELLDKEELAEEEEEGEKREEYEKKQDNPIALPKEQLEQIELRLKEWCDGKGYKDSAVNMLTLSRNIQVSKDDLTQYFDKVQGSTFRIWLSDIRFKAAQQMMLDYPDFSNDVISAECGFSSRSYLYKIFKERTGKTPTEWRAKVSIS